MLPIPGVNTNTMPSEHIYSLSALGSPNIKRINNWFLVPPVFKDSALAQLNKIRPFLSRRLNMDAELTGWMVYN